MTRTITDHEDALIADLNTAEDKLCIIKQLCELNLNTGIYSADALATIILARINRKETNTLTSG